MIRGESSSKQIESHLRRGEWEQVINICRQTLANDPDRLNFYPYLAKAYAQQGKFAAAVSAYRKILGTKIDQAEVFFVEYHFARC